MNDLKTYSGEWSQSSDELDDDLSPSWWEELVGDEGNDLIDIDVFPDLTEDVGSLSGVLRQRAQVVRGQITEDLDDEGNHFLGNAQWDVSEDVANLLGELRWNVEGGFEQLGDDHGRD